MLLREWSYVSDQATSDSSCEYDEFELSCDEYVEISNELKSPRRATCCYDTLPMIFLSSYNFKRI